MPLRDKHGFVTNPEDEEKYKFDGFSHSISVIQEEHRLIHSGMVFTVNIRFSGLTNGSNFDVAMQNPAGNFPHLRGWSYSLEDGPCEVTLYEGGTITFDGTEYTPVNNNRNSSKTANLVIEEGPTITLPGNPILESQYVPDPGGGFFAGTPGTGVSDLSEEWVLAPDENYLLRLTNNSGGTIEGSLYLIFYEISYDH